MKIVIDIPVEMYKAIVDGMWCGNLTIGKAIANSTPLPKEKVGHWIIIDDCEKFIAKCSVCGRIEDSRRVHKYRYCHCGARMKGE